MRIGLRIRAVRHRLGWRQSDVATRAAVSQDTVSRVERGQLGALQLRTIRAVCRALEIELAQEVRWRGGDLDRLADEGHATLVAAVCRLLERAGWVVQPEVSFSVYGERGSIDVLAWHPGARMLLVVEVKTSLVSVEETLRRHDVKVRLASAIARDRLGWAAAGVSRLLVLPDDSTSRRRVGRHAAVLDRVYAVRGRAATAWLRDPIAARGLLVFLSPTLARRTGQTPVSRRRVRTPADAPETSHLRSYGVPSGTQGSNGGEHAGAA